MSLIYCQLNHIPDPGVTPLPPFLPPIAGYKIMAPFFADVNGLNTLGVDKEDTNYIAMEAARDAYEDYYAEKMEVVTDAYDDLSAELEPAAISVKLNTIYNYKRDIEGEYLDTGVALWAYMALIDAELPAAYKTLLTSIGG